jgi:hypothetical protein
VAEVVCSFRRERNKNLDVQGAGAQERWQRYAFLFCAHQNRHPEP